MKGKGFSGTILLVGLAILSVIFLVGFLVYREKSLVQTAISTPTSSPVLTPTVTSSPSKIPTEFKIGDEVKLNSGPMLSLKRAWLDVEFSKMISESTEAAKLYEGKKLLNVEVSFTNKESIAASYKATPFRLKDSKDQVYQVRLRASKEYSPLAEGPLLSGETVRGGISFLVPSEETHFKLMYENAIISFSLNSGTQTGSF
jgi:hypothetical protein